MSLSSLAFADGGAGGVSPIRGFGSAGGTTSLTGAGGNGQDSFPGGGGGGGGGAGTTGGRGGKSQSATPGFDLPGGSGGASAGASGVNGTSGSYFTGGGGGGGGAHGAVVNSNTSNAGTVAGGAGGAGGDSPFVTNGDGGGGGGGGGGGYGVVVNGSGLTYTNNGTLIGGAGGAGGGSDGFFSGNGGDGGVGIAFTATGTVSNSGSITGGNGGAAGRGSAGGTDGSNGAGGAGIAGSGLTIINSGIITGGLNGDGATRANAITFTGGANTLELQAGSTITGNVVDQTNNGTFRLGGTTSSSFNVSNVGAAAQYQGFSTFVKTGASTWTLTGTTAAATPWSVNQGTLAISSDGNLGAASGGLSFGGGTLQFLSGVISNRAVTLNAGGGTFDTNGNTAILSGTISGVGGLSKIGTGTLVLNNNLDGYSGGTNLNAGALQVGANNALGTGALTMATGTTLQSGAAALTVGNAVTLAGTGTIDTQANTFTMSGAISGTGALNKNGSGTLALAGTDNYSGATTINGGTLEVDGSIAGSASVAVNSGTTLSGIGIVDSATTTIKPGGTLAPGNASSPTGILTVSGNLAFQAGALYLVQATPSAASSTVVAGSATLTGATVDAVFAGSGYLPKQYTILTASGGLGGTTFAGLTNTNLPAGFTDKLSYSGNTVILSLTASLGSRGGLNSNQQNVAGALNNFFNNGGSLPPGFVSIFGASSGNLATALTQLSGETATGAQLGAFRFMGQFLGLMLDPFIDGRGGAPGTGGPLGFAPERRGVPEDVALAYASAMKARGYRAPQPVGFEPRWTSWAGAFGGYNRTNGDPATSSHDLTASAGGVAAGLDYHFSRDALVGFSLAGGGMKWDLTQGLGMGKSDTFAGGVYGAIRSGAAYVAASFGGGNHWMSTDRFAAFGDHLTASFNGESFGGRVEGGYRFGIGTGGIAPYAAMQAQSFHTPTYSEADLTGGGFGLTYNGRTASDTRSELGARFDRAALVSPDSVLTFHGRLAWAHDWISSPTLAATFQALPGASFLVDGAPPAKDTALVSAGAELKLARGISLLGRFDGEFASKTQTYAGTGTIRVNW